MSTFGPEAMDTASVYNKRILASTSGLVPKSITIAPTVVDATNPEGTNIIRAGKILCPITSAGATLGLYVVYNPLGADGSQLEANAVVLMNDYTMDGVNPCIAEAAVGGYFIKSAMIVDVAFDYALANKALNFSDGYYR